jgi:shikimate 5-dehydrogenase
MSYKVAMLVPEGVTPRSPALWKEYAGIDVHVVPCMKVDNVCLNGWHATIIGAPFKTEAMKWGICSYGECSKIEATNFIYSAGGKTGVLHNTDSYGFGKAVEETYGFLPYDLRVLVLGAGATGRAILHWFSSRHQMDKVYIWNRTEAKALKAAVDFNCNVCPNSKSYGFYDFVIDSRSDCNQDEDYLAHADVTFGTFSESMAKHQALKAMSILFNDEKYLML